jgi:CrcB protein
MKETLLVLAGGAVGAAARYLIGVLAKGRLVPAFPHWGTFLANMAASLVLGFVVEAGTRNALGATGEALLATGFCGALSTWSTFSHEVLALASMRRAAGAALYLSVTVAVGLGLSFVGMAAAQGF